jgi:hypothetical protein
MLYYDDNFGSWHNTDDADVREFYEYTQRRSITKTCKGCGYTVRLLPQYAYCNACADAIEYGGEF